MQLLETNVGLERKGKISRLDHANFMPYFAQMCDQPDRIMQNLEGCSNFCFFITRDVRVNLRALRLIPGPIEHPASPVGR